MDRFYRRILTGLDGHLDPDVFEACVCDLLRDAFPGLVPVRGGGDAGMDGAIADGEGEAYPPVCTTSEDVIGNLTASLDSYLKQGQPRRKVILATSQRLTPTHRRNLEKRAREKGFTLVQVVDREGVAQRLRWSPTWCHNLGIPWEASALSAVPKTRRPLLEIEPVGREKDLEWLRGTTGDWVLSGQPGSGKTFLIYQLVREGWGLFLVDDDRQAIAEALAEERPQVVVIDDAHVKLTLIDELRQLREDVGHPFDIAATTWEGDRHRVAQGLGALPPEKVHKLELLTREEILEVYLQSGIDASNRHLKELIDQAANRPGLAVTLAEIWRRGGWREVQEGKVLHSNLLAIFRGLVGEEAEPILGAFALGGDRGVALEQVAHFLKLGLPAAWQKASGLAAGGVLAEVETGTLAVWPRTLRSSLLRTVFFPDSRPRLDYRPLLEVVANKASAVEALAHSAQRGAPIAPSELHHLVVSYGKASAWRELASVSAEEARWVLGAYPKEVEDVARNALQKAPEAAIPRLLERSGRNKRSWSVLGVPSTAPQILAEWVLQASRPAAALERRRLLARGAKAFLAKGGETQAALGAFCLAVSPRWEVLQEDPADDRRGTLSRGFAPLEALRELPALWQEIRDSVIELVSEGDALAWQTVKGTLWRWIYPDYGIPSVAGDIPRTLREVMTDFAVKALQDLAPLATGNPGFAAALTDLARRAGTELAIPEDPVFELLYPADALEPKALREQELQWVERLEALAGDWSKEPASVVASRLAGYETQAVRTGYRGFRRTWTLCRYLAQRVERPSSWLEHFVGEALPPDLVAPFMEESLRRKDALWERALLGTMTLEQYVYAGTCVLLQATDVPTVLFETANLSPRAVENLSLRKELPLTRIRLLLEHSDPDAALAAAFGEWYSDPQGDIRPELAAPWRRAILNASPQPSMNYLEGNLPAEYWLGNILAGNPTLAFDWLRRYLEKEQAYLNLALIASAVNALDRQKRFALLGVLEPHAHLLEALPHLVGTDIELYRHLLGREALQPYHLAPLQGGPSPAWVGMARAAIDMGHGAAEVAAAAFGRSFAAGSSHSWKRRDYEFWRRWIADFADLEENLSPEIREIGQHARRIAEAHLPEAGLNSAKESCTAPEGS